MLSYVEGRVAANLPRKLSGLRAETQGPRHQVQLTAREAIRAGIYAESKFALFSVWVGELEQGITDAAILNPYFLKPAK